MIDTAKCRRLKTAIAEQSGIIQAQAERELMETTHYLVNRIPEQAYDETQGVNPRKLRYSLAPVPDAPYQDLLVNGFTQEGMPTRNACNGDPQNIDASVNQRGAAGCNLTGHTLSGGWDEFYRVLKGKAFETDPMCVLDLLEKERADAYVNMLREGLPKVARDQFQYSLERNVIDFGFYNVSMVNGFTHARGRFPAVPQGGLNLPYFRRLFTIMEAEGWKGNREVGPVSREAFEKMRLNYKAQYNMELNSSIDSDETHYVEDGIERINWGGISWVICNTPLRGYLETLPDGTFNFVPIRPTRPRVGTGGGLVSEINPDYFECRYNCNGVSEEIYEVAFFVGPDAANRQAFAMPQMAGKSFDRDKFNFSVNMVEGSYLDCNDDNFKFKHRLLHAYAFESLNPELLGAAIYKVSPECIVVGDTCCDPVVSIPTGSEIAAKEPQSAPKGECEQAECNSTECDDDLSGYIDPQGDQDAPCATETEGIVQFSDCGPIQALEEAGNVTITVHRVGGSIGAATVDFATADGTGVDGIDYTATAGTITWDDGDNTPQTIVIPVIDSGNAPVAFVLALSNAVGAALANGINGCVSVTIEVLDTGND